MITRIEDDRHYNVIEVSEALGLEEAVVRKWLRERAALRAPAGADVAVRGATVRSLWTSAPPKVLLHRAPIDARRELAAYCVGSETKRDEAVRLSSLLRYLHLENVDALWDITLEQVNSWIARDKRRWASRHAEDIRDEQSQLSDEPVENDQDQRHEAEEPNVLPHRRGRTIAGEKRHIRRILAALASARGRELPAWAHELYARKGTLARTSADQWIDHPWRDDVDAAIAQIHGTQGGVLSSATNLRLLTFHLRDHASPGATLGEALISPPTVVAAIKAIQNASRDRTGSWSSTSEKHLLEAIRPVLVAGAEGGPLSQQSARALSMYLRDFPSYRAMHVKDMVRHYKQQMKAELRRANVVPAAARKIHPPEDEVVAAICDDVAVLLEGALARHAGRGMTIKDWQRWRTWEPELRNVLCSAVCVHLLGAGGLRGGSLHAVQPIGIRADDSFPGAVRIDRLIVKRVAHEGVDGITTSHDNRPYDVDTAPGIECSTWTVLPFKGFPYALRDVLEWYLHSCGQCLGPANGCDAAVAPVLRWIDVVPDLRGWAYREAAQAHTPAHTTFVSKTGEWLARLSPSAGRSVRFNPFWWGRDANQPVLQQGLVDRLNVVFGSGLHRWRHYALLYLTTAYALSLEEAALLIHMDPQTARTIYNNPSTRQILARLRSRLEARPDDEIVRELEQARTRIAGLQQLLRERDHHLAYLATVFGLLPQPPSQLPPVIGPKPVLPSPPARKRASPLGGQAFTA